MSTLPVGPEKASDPYLRIGDHICLYCTDVHGYAFCETTSSAENAVTIYTDQNKVKPEHILQPAVVSFRIEIENRYKLNKKLRQLNEAIHFIGPNEEDEHHLHATQEAAEAETRDNEAELKRLLGKKIKYGDTIQLKHLFTETYLHVNPSKTGQRDKTCVQTYLQLFNGKEAQFRVLPKFKVNTEGEHVRIKDQVVIESVKYPGQFLTASKPFMKDKVKHVCELNLGSKHSAFTMVKRNNPSDSNSLWGGSVVQFHHKDLEAYLSAEGIQGQCTEDVHFLVSEVGYSDPQLKYSPFNTSTYWQMEHAESIIKGDQFEWGQHIRIQHLLTRHYLCVKDDTVTLCSDSDPITVFKIHPMYDDLQLKPLSIVDGIFVKLEHILTGRWLHAEKTDPYKRSNHLVVPRKETLTKIKSTEELQYQDAFSLQRMNNYHLKDANYIMGILPLLNNAIQGIKVAGELSNAEAQNTILTLSELKEFVEETKQRGTLLVEFKVIDLAIDILKLLGLRIDPVASNMCYVIYELLYIVVSGKDWDISLYVAQYMSFFQTLIQLKPSDSLACTRMLTELCRDKKHVMDRMTSKQIENCANLLKKYKHPVYLQLLSTLCMCKGIAIPVNQKLVCDSLVYKHKGYLYKFEIQADGQIYVWKRSSRDAVLLSDLIKGASDKCNQQDTVFLKEQLILFESMCHGRNQICIDAITECGYLSVEVVILVLREENITGDIRALFCKLFICLFIEVGNNTPITDTVSKAFGYRNLDPSCTADTWLNEQAQLGQNTLCIKGTEVLDWVIKDLKDNCLLKGNTKMKNKLILAQLQLIHNLIEYGYCEVAVIREIRPVLMLLMIGERHKKESERYQTLINPKNKSKINSRLSALFPALLTSKPLQKSSFRRPDLQNGTSEVDETVVAVKYQCMVILELLMKLQTNYRLQKFVGLFKLIEVNDRTGEKERHQLAGFLYEQQDNKKKWWFNSPRDKLRSAVDSVINDTTFLTDENLNQVLLDLACYNDEKMTSMALSLLNKYCNTSTILYKLAEQAQILLTKQSISIHSDVQQLIPTLRRLVSVKVYTEQVNVVCGILQKLAEYCHRPDETSRPNHCAQNVLVNHGILPLMLELLQMEEHDKKGDENTQYERLISNALQLFYTMAKDNDSVQDYLFENISILLSVKYAVKDLAEVLKEIFLNNSSVCWQVEKQQVDKIFTLIHQHKAKAPNFIQVLQNIVVVKHGEGFIKRNQDLILRVGSERHPEFCFIFDLPKETREKILLGQTSPEMRGYLVHMLNLITICSKDTKGPNQSFCQNLLSVDEVLNVINHPMIINNMKRPYLKYFTCVCLNSPTPGQVFSSMHLNDLWDFLEKVEYLMGSLMNYMRSLPTPQMLSVKVIEDDYVPSSGEDIDIANLWYFIDGILPLLEAITKLYKSDQAAFPQEFTIMKRLTIRLIDFAPLLSVALNQEKHFNSLKTVVRRCAISSSIPASDLTECLSKLDLHFKPLKHKRSWEYRNGGLASSSKSETALSDHDLEHFINCKFQNFVKSCEALTMKDNAVGAQLPVKGKVSGEISKKEYTHIDSSEALPLSIDFQNHVKTFVSHSYKHKTGALCDQSRFKNITVLIRQLEIIAKKAKVGIPTADEALELRTLQILRATLHNKIVLIPDHVEGKKRTRLSKMTEVVQLQDFFVNHGVIPIILDLLTSKSGSVFREVLALLNCLLYDAHGSVQNEAINYFKKNRDEMFFNLVLDFLKQAAMVTKERRALENELQRDQMREQLLEHEKQRKSIWKFFKFNKPRKIGILNRDGTVEKKKAHEEEEFKKEQLRYFRDDGTLQLVFQVMAKLCDGQHKELQDYLREQPDNPRSYNLVASVTHYLQITFHTITNDTIGLVIQVFDTLGELCAGNQENRLVILDGKVIDYINFILRNEGFPDCSLEATLKLYKSIAELLISMIEESSPEAFKVAKDVGNTVDVFAIAHTMQKCYNIQTSISWSHLVTLVNVMHTQKLTSAKLVHVADLARRVGYKYYIVFARINDVHPEISTETYNKLLSCGKALEHYRGNILNIEINKEGYLQKIYFPVAKYKNLIRSEIKESLKWSIDRSSPSEKIRDFMRWSKLIMKSITYQQRILRNPFSRFFIKHILTWHYIMILLSLTINIIMMVTWHAKVSVADVLSNATSLPGDIYNPIPDVHMDYWEVVFVVLAIVHNLFTFILVVTFFMAENPTLPKFPNVRLWFSDDKSAGKELKDTTKESVTYLISIKTFYYLLLFVTSMLGSFTYGYFFAFHLFDIVTVNQLLKGVTRAVTLNGRSLIYVAILGLVFLYVYALLGFALFRPVFIPANELYCDTLWQCSVTIVRYGLVGIDEVLRRHPLENNFTNFGYLVLYQVTFFIFFTTIGLNIIFGIIVDTFSELRDRKWRAEKDMHDFCFICSLPSYELEHHGKGFYHHVSHEHNMWAYIYYFIYLANTNVNDYTALDYYVYQLLDEENYGFFPLNKALCLTHLQEQEVEEDPMKVMAREVSFLVRKANEKMLHKKLKRERKQREKLKRKSGYSKAPRIIMSATSMPSDEIPDQQQVLLPTRGVLLAARDTYAPTSSTVTDPNMQSEHQSLYRKGPHADRGKSRSRSRTRGLSGSSQRSSSRSPHRSSPHLSPRTGSVTDLTTVPTKESRQTPSQSRSSSPGIASEIRKKVRERRIKAIEKEVSERKTTAPPPKRVLRRHMTLQHGARVLDEVERTGYASDVGRDKSSKPKHKDRPSTP